MLTLNELGFLATEEQEYRMNDRGFLSPLGEVDSAREVEFAHVALYRQCDEGVGFCVEVSGDGYVRQRVLLGARGTNARRVEFPTATGNWGTVVAVRIFDGRGNRLADCRISSTAVCAGDSLRFERGAIELRIA